MNAKSNVVYIHNTVQVNEPRQDIKQGDTDSLILLVYPAV